MPAQCTGQRLHHLKPGTRRSDTAPASRTWFAARVLRHSRRLLAITVAVATVAAAWLAPASRARVTAAATVAEALDLPLWRPFAPTVTTRSTALAGHDADLYSGRRGAPPVVLVPGAAPAGRQDRRVVDLARVLARADRDVVVPELAVYGEDLVEEDVERLVDIVLDLAGDRGQVVLVGISFGGSLALVAAADPRLEDRVAGVATFGAYADLVGVLQAATTGVSVVDGRVMPWDGDPRAQQIVQEQLIGLLPAEAARAVRAALDGDLPVGRLPPDLAAVHDLLTNDDPDRVHLLAAQLPPSVRARLEAVSPVAVADRLQGVPVVAMHAREDPVIPYGEVVRLASALPHARVLTVEGLGHAELQVTRPRGWLGALGDLRTLWTFSSRTLRWQEPTWPWGPG